MCILSNFEGKKINIWPIFTEKKTVKSISDYQKQIWLSISCNCRFYEKKSRKL